MEELTSFRLKRRTLLKGFGIIGLTSLVSGFSALRTANGEALPRVRVSALQLDRLRLAGHLDEN